MSDDDKSGSEGEEEPTQTLASSRTRRDNAGKRFLDKKKVITISSG